ncbi:MAG: Coenzyme F420 hydrogenase/dehydrogenase, beta subunit C-terminal domain, partial [Candidatus Cryptobacteroides sp.]
MLEINNPADCCGCSACAAVCPRNAIVMSPDALGFLYPSVDPSRCIDCGLCDSVCSFKEDYNTSANLDEPLSFAARHINEDEVMRSRSGAAFVAITDVVLGQGGSVYGAAFGEHFKVIHKRAVTKEERDSFRGSKYVQSEMGDVFTQVREDLKQGRIVLFSGTPCQTAGLSSFIGPALSANLFLIDIVCHGVPSPALWQDYLKYLEKKQGGAICSIDFRDKQRFGWKAHKESVVFPSETVNNPWFVKLFYQNIMLRHSCSNCHFSNTRRPSDITLGDFWGWEKQDPSLNADDKGVNLLLVNTEKGKALLDKASPELVLSEASPECYM